jgi:hypothetical protein
MKTRIVFCGILMAAAFPLPSWAGTIFYVPIPAEGSDAQAGLERTKVYTSGIAAGSTKAAGRTVNGVSLAPLAAAGNSSSANGVTLTAATGTLANGGGKSESIKADGAMSDLLSGMIFNEGAADNSEQYVVLDPASLAPGKTYDLRVYICNASGENRQVNLSFAGDGKPAVNTDFFNEDDATTSSGGFADPNQVYYINYRFTWDGVSTPGFTATQRLGSTPFCLYAVTNEEVGAEVVEARPAGAVVNVEPEPIAAPPLRSSRTTAVDYEDDIGVSSEVFYNADTLRRNGRWVTVGTYGRCWSPSGVDDDWQPYTRGRWVHSNNDGWMWDSDEDFGWATYHYGRWFREESVGWCWVPGRVWAPAWVSWRHGHSYVGWAPLPPLALAAAGVGIGSWADHRYGIGPRAYNFVNARDFGSRSMAGVLLPRQQNARVMTNTVNVTNIARSKHGIFNGGPNFQAMNNALVRSGGAVIPTASLARQAGMKPVTQDGKFSHLSAGVLSVAAPTVTRTNRKSELPKVAETIAAPKLDRGWKGITDPKHTTALQAKIASETPGTKAKNAPARLPGTMPTVTAAPGTASTTPMKPFRNGKPPGTAVVTPTQPATAVVTPPQPGTAPTPLIKPAHPVNPTLTAPVPPAVPTVPGVPGVPGVPIAGNDTKHGGKPAVPNIPGTQPGASGSPIVIAPPKPGKPVLTAPPTVDPADQPAITTRGKNGRPGKPGTPLTVTPPVTVPPAVQPTVPKTALVPTPEPARIKKGKPQPAIPAPTTPGAAPIIEAAPTPEPVRIPKRIAPEPAPIIKPAPTPEPVRIPKRIAPEPAPIIKPAPTPEPVRIPKRIAPEPAPIIKPAPTPEPVRIPRRIAPEPAPIVKPAPTPEPVRIPRRIAPEPAPAPIVRPAPAPVRTQPPAFVQPRPAPAPAPVVRPAPAPMIPAPPVFVPPPRPAPGVPVAPTPTPAPTLTRGKKS